MSTDVWHIKGPSSSLWVLAPSRAHSIWSSRRVRCFSESQKKDIDMTPMNSYDTKTSRFIAFWMAVLGPHCHLHDVEVSVGKWRKRRQRWGLRIAERLTNLKNNASLHHISWKHRLEVCFSSSLCAVAGRINRPIRKWCFCGLKIRQIFRNPIPFLRSWACGPSRRSWTAMNGKYRPLVSMLHIRHQN